MTNEGPAEPPTISVVVIVYDMPEQAMNTLYTLSRKYQRGVEDISYEVVVVENLSDRNLKPKKVRALGPEFRYVAREEPGVSPVWALREGIEMARGEIIGMMIDGARMVTPGVIRNVADAYKAFPDAVVATAGFHLGDEDHQHRHHSETSDRRLLRSIPWRENGYLLYTQATIAVSNPHGFLHAMMESNCMFVMRSALDEVGGPDVRFDQIGGGALNPDLYRILVERPGAQLVMLAGEASFHQFHGGVTTKKDDQREELLQSFRDRYVAVRGGSFEAPLKAPIVLGEISPYAMPFLHFSAMQGKWRFHAMARRSTPRPPWEDEPVVIDLDVLDDPFGVGGVEEAEEVSIYWPPSLGYFHARRLEFSSWSDHTQFGYDLVAAIKPELLVELGTGSAVSYFTFCQAVDEFSIQAQCYAIDPWKQRVRSALARRPSMYDAVKKYNEQTYPQFSHLLRMSLGVALSRFENDAIDLLSIVGMETYEEVSAAFRSWEPKVSPGGLVLIHNIAPRMKDFGVWNFWEELRLAEEDTFEFDHGMGLGVWRKPGGEPSSEPLIRFMFDSTPGVQSQLRKFYVHAAQFHNFRREVTGQ